VVRALLAVVGLCGCDRALGLEAPPDTPPDASTESGCADGTREGFVDVIVFQALAGCQGAWTIAGLRPVPAPQCELRAGNDGANRPGTGCTASDLCAPGWAPCATHLDVHLRIADRACSDATTTAGVFFATGQSGPGGGTCNADGTNDVFGCGTMGDPTVVDCGPLDKGSDNECIDLVMGGWDCMAPDEIKTIHKADPFAGGGVLCCRTEA
jgi:hypothetical protein